MEVRPSEALHQQVCVYIPPTHGHYFNILIPFENQRFPTAVTLRVDHKRWHQQLVAPELSTANLFLKPCNENFDAALRHALFYL